MFCGGGQKRKSENLIQTISIDSCINQTVLLFCESVKPRDLRSSFVVFFLKKKNFFTHLKHIVGCVTAIDDAMVMSKQTN